TPFFVLWTAIALRVCSTFLRRCLISATVAAPVFMTVGQTLAVSKGELDPNFAPQADQYGGSLRGGFKLLDDWVGDIAVLPGGLSYAMRFGLPVRTWRQATVGGFYQRDYRDMKFTKQDISFLNLDDVGLTNGFFRTSDGLVL